MGVSSDPGETRRAPFRDAQESNSITLAAIASIPDSISISRASCMHHEVCASATYDEFVYGFFSI
jgi:hypothetical protein